MPENDRHNGCLSDIELGSVKREAPPKQFMILDEDRVNRARFTIHNRVHKADLQPKESRSPDQVAGDETVSELPETDDWV